MLLNPRPGGGGLRSTGFVPEWFRRGRLVRWITASLLGLGVIAPVHAFAPTPAAATVRANRSTRFSREAPPDTALMTYQGGPVQHSSTVYAVFWQPPSYVFPSGYVNLVSRYFTDVAHDSFKTSNVYAVGTQYYDRTGG
jgi:hypothetical protein